MTEFRSPPEEVTRLLAELRDVKEAVRGLATRVTAIDKHIRRAYQIPNAPRVSRPPRRSSPSSPSRDVILRRFDALRSTFVNLGAAETDTSLASIATDDLRDLARELGLPNAGKASIERIRALILQRLRESALLGVGTVLKGAEETARASGDVAHQAPGLVTEGPSTESDT